MQVLRVDMEMVSGRTYWSLGFSLLPWIPGSLGLEPLLVIGDTEGSTTSRRQGPGQGGFSQGADAFTVSLLVMLYMGCPLLLF